MRSLRALIPRVPRGSSGREPVHVQAAEVRLCAQEQEAEGGLTTGVVSETPHAQHDEAGLQTLQLCLHA